MENAEHDIRILVETSANGDAEGFKRLYDHLVDKVYNYLRYRTATPEVAEDLTQDAFVSLYQALPSFTYRSRAEFYAFVFTIVRRSLARHYGDKHTKAQYLRADIDGDLVPGEVMTGDQGDIERALSTLPPLTREVVILHHWSGYTFAEIGVLLSLTESAARVRHHRALETMRDYFNTQ